MPIRPYGIVAALFYRRGVGVGVVPRWDSWRMRRSVPTAFSMQYDRLACGCAGARGNAGGDDNVGRGVAFAVVDAAWFVLIRPFEITMASIYWCKCYAPTGVSRCKDLSPR